jgi:hypothetical protein
MRDREAVDGNHRPILNIRSTPTVCGKPRIREFRLFVLHPQYTPFEQGMTLKDTEGVAVSTYQ